jgi:hypothetical protein
MRTTPAENRKVLLWSIGSLGKLVCDFEHRFEFVVCVTTPNYILDELGRDAPLIIIHWESGKARRTLEGQ